MISSTLIKLLSSKKWHTDDTPQYFPQVCDNPEVFVTWKEVEKCLNNPQFYELNFIDHHGFKINIPAWKRPWTNGYTPEVSDVIDQYNHGHSVIINNFEYMDGKQKLLGEIETYFPNIRAAFHVYCGTETSRSFNIHEDDAYNLILQVDGETHWIVYKNRMSELMTDFRYNEDDLEIAIDVTMVPGDMLYIPKKCLHQAHPKGKRLSISIPMVTCEYAGDEMKYQDRKYYGIT